MEGGEATTRMEEPALTTENAADLAAQTTGSVAQPLPVIFRKVQALYNSIESGDVPQSELQQKLADGLSYTEAAVRQVVTLDVFSRNELIEDVNTGDIKYLLLPFYRGDFLSRLNEHEPPKRLRLLRAAEACFKGFLGDLQRLEALSKETRRGWEMASSADAIDPGELRTQKIERMKAAQAARKRMQLLSEKMSAARVADDEDDVNEIEREHVLLLVQSSAHAALDAIRSLSQEIDMLEQIEKMRRPDGTLPPREPSHAETAEEARTRFRTMTLLPQTASRMLNDQLNPTGRLSYAAAHEQIHTGVIPGLYTYSVEEGLRYEEAQRAMEEAQRMTEMGDRAQERRDKSAEAEEDGEEDEEELRKQRAKDDWRDTHKRGYGNRRNYS